MMQSGVSPIIKAGGHMDAAVAFSDTVSYVPRYTVAPSFESVASRNQITCRDSVGQTSILPTTKHLEHILPYLSVTLAMPVRIVVMPPAPEVPRLVARNRMAFE